MKQILSLFSGCGGMDLGMLGGFKVHRNAINPNIHKFKGKADTTWVELPKTNFEIVFANDILPEARSAYVPYFTKDDPPVFHTDSIVDLVKKAKNKQFSFPKADVVIGGFPCQDFSVAGNRLGFNSNKNHEGELDIDTASVESRGMLYTWMKEVIELVKPKMFIAENVKGLVSLGDVKRIIEHDFRNIGEGYIVPDAITLNAANYGVPQSRQRVFFIGFNKEFLKDGVAERLAAGEISPYPPATHFLPGETPENSLLKEYVNLKDILSDLPEPNDSADPAQQAYSKAKFYGRHVQGQTEVKMDGVGPTIRAEHHGNIEFRRLSKENGGKNTLELEKGLKERRLTVREAARIQTFPDDYDFIRPRVKGEPFPLSASGAYRVIGNAVPPLLAFNIALHLDRIWNEIFRDT